MRLPFQCEICGRPIFEGRAKYTLDKYGMYLCGSQLNGSYCQQIRERELKQIENARQGNEA